MPFTIWSILKVFCLLCWTLKVKCPVCWRRKGKLDKVKPVTSLVVHQAGDYPDFCSIGHCASTRRKGKRASSISQFRWIPLGQSMFRTHSWVGTTWRITWWQYHFRQFLPVDSCYVSLPDASCQLPWKCEEVKCSYESFCTILNAER